MLCFIFCVVTYSVRYPCEVPLFTCMSGQCINMSLVQDHVVNCDDASDEGMYITIHAYEIHTS